MFNNPDPEMATKPTTSRAKTAKPEAAPAPAPVAPEVAGEEAKEGVTLKLKGLMERIGAKSDVRKRDLRAVVELTLAELGAALARGEGVNLPGLGHMRVARKADGGSMTLKLRPADPAKEKPAKGEDAAKEALAEVGEAD